MGIEQTVNFPRLSLSACLPWTNNKWGKKKDRNDGGTTERQKHGGGGGGGHLRC